MNISNDTMIFNWLLRSVIKKKQIKILTPYGPYNFKNLLFLMTHIKTMNLEFKTNFKTFYQFYLKFYQCSINFKINPSCLARGALIFLTAPLRSCEQ